MVVTDIVSIKNAAQKTKNFYNPPGSFLTVPLESFPRWPPKWPKFEKHLFYENFMQVLHMSFKLFFWYGESDFDVQIMILAHLK